jgi:hypothetical protein
MPQVLLVSTRSFNAAWRQLQRPFMAKPTLEQMPLRGCLVPPAAPAGECAATSVDRGRETAKLQRERKRIWLGAFPGRLQRKVFKKRQKGRGCTWNRLIVAAEVDDESAQSVEEISREQTQDRRDRHRPFCHLNAGLMMCMQQLTTKMLALVAIPDLHDVEQLQLYNLQLRRLVLQQTHLHSVWRRADWQEFDARTFCRQQQRVALAARSKVRPGPGPRHRYRSCLPRRSKHEFNART